MKNVEITNIEVKNIETENIKHKKKRLRVHDDNTGIKLVKNNFSKIRQQYTGFF